MKELKDKWVAIKHKTTNEGFWLISKLDYFILKGSIPDGKSGLKIDGVDEVSDHEVCAKKGYCIDAQLALAGIEKLEDPIWYFYPRFHNYNPNHH